MRNIEFYRIGSYCVSVFVSYANESSPCETISLLAFKQYVDCFVRWSFSERRNLANAAVKFIKSSNLDTAVVWYFLLSNRKIQRECPCLKSNVERTIVGRNLSLKQASWVYPSTKWSRLRKNSLLKIQIKRRRVSFIRRNKKKKKKKETRLPFHQPSAKLIDPAACLCKWVQVNARQRW